MTTAPAPPRSTAWPREAKIALGVLVAITLLGAWLRSLGYFDGQNGLWWDEASWVRRILAGKYGIRPVGYARLSRYFLEIDLSEWLIRLPSYVAGLLTAPVAAWLFRRAGLSWAATCLGTFVLAVHPWAVAYAKEFKPYAFDLLFHAAVAGAGASYLRRPSPRRLAFLASLVLFAPLFSWTAAALYPGLLVLVLLSQRARKARGELIAMSVMAGLAVAGAVTIYITRLADRKLSAGYWARKYGVFFEGDDASGRAGWLAEQTWDLARFPGRLEAAYGSVETSELVFGTLLGLLVGFGIFTISRKRDWTSAVLWLSPWLVVLAVHLVGIWPYGVFRTNLFFLLYPLGLSLVGFDEAVRLLQARSAPASLSWLGPALVGITMLAFLPYSPSRFAIKSHESGAHATSARRVLLDLGARKLPAATPIILDAHACAAWAHYTRRAPDRKDLNRGVRRLKISCLPARRRELLEPLGRALRRRESWVYFASTREPESDIALVRKLCQVVEARAYPTGDVLVHCQPLPRSRPRPSPTAEAASALPSAAAPISSSAPIGSSGVAPPPRMD